jgi:hypothetical protein
MKCLYGTQRIKNQYNWSWELFLNNIRWNTLYKPKIQLFQEKKEYKTSICDFKSAVTYDRARKTNAVVIPLNERQWMQTQNRK